MSLGLGILLASLFLGTVYLYVHTKERWNWGKLPKRILIATGIVAVALMSTVLAYFGYEKWKLQPKIATSLQGISLGETFSDVTFKHGAFEKIEGDSAKNENEEQRYIHRAKRSAIDVRNGVVSTVLYACKQDDSDYTTVNNVQCNDSGEKILETFGNTVRILCPKKLDEEAPFLRVYDVVDYGIRYRLKENRVIAFIIAERSDLEGWHGKNWDSCK